MQVGNLLGSLDQQLHGTVQIAATRRQHALVVEFDDFLADLIEQGLAGIRLAGFFKDAGDLFGQMRIFVILCRDLTHQFLGRLLLARGKAGMRQIDRQPLGNMPTFFRGLGADLLLQLKRLVDQFLGFFSRSFGFKTKAFGHQHCQLALLVAPPLTLHLGRQLARAIDFTALDQNARQIGEVIDGAQR